MSVCLRFEDLSALATAFTAAGLIDCENGMWTDANASQGTFYMVDDAGTGVRCDSENNVLDGAWCCFFPANSDTLPTSLEEFVHEDVGDCCNLAVRA